MCAAAHAQASHLREDRAPDRADDGHNDDADAGGSADMREDGNADGNAESGPGETSVRWRTERRPPLAADSSSTCRGGGAMRLRPSPSPASAAAAACMCAERKQRQHHSLSRLLAGFLSQAQTHMEIGVFT